MTAAVVDPKATGSAGIQCSPHLYEEDLAGCSVNNKLVVPASTSKTLRLFSVDLSKRTEAPADSQSQSCMFGLKISADPLLCALL